MSERLSRAVVAAVDAAKILGVRAGAASEHRFIGIWAVVVEERVFARSWSQAKSGWYRAFLDDPRGTLQIGERRVRVQIVRVRSERLRKAVDAAYAAKYPTPGSAVYVRGFRSAKRRATTVEFVPAAKGRR